MVIKKKKESRVPDGKVIFSVMLSVLVFISSLGLAQSYRGSIKNNPSFNWGEGSGSSQDEAKQAAAADLINKIWVAITVDRTANTEENIESDEVNYKSKWIESISSYSSLYLTGLHYQVKQANDGFIAIAYISKDDLSKSFARRKSEIIDYVNLGSMNENTGDLANSLKNYYWAYLLSHTYPDTICFNDKSMISCNPQIALTGKIRNIISSVSVQTTDVYHEYETVIADLRVNYKGRPVNNLNFSYYSGLATDYACVNDGRVTIPIYDDPTYPEREITLSIEYASEADMKSNKEISRLYEFIGKDIINNTVTVLLRFPWLVNNDLSSEKDTVSKVKESAPDFPQVINILCRIQSSSDFLRVLEQYRKLEILNYGNSYSSSKSIDNFVAVLDSNMMCGLFFFNGEIFREVSSGRIINNLADDFSGKRQVWIQITNHR